MVKIRPATLKGCEECVKLAFDVKLYATNGKKLPLWWMQSFVKEKQLFLVAEEKKQIIGFIFGERLTGNGLMVHLTAVNQKYQGKGIGNRLVKELEKEAKKRKAKFLFRYTEGSNKAMIHILEKQGHAKGKKYIEFLKDL
jgi:ribosomal protein S18 acetylase RimI-like enzyme